MADTIIFPALFTILASVGAILGIFILIANARATMNRVTFALMLLISLNNISLIGMLSSITPRGALTYHWLLTATTYAMGPALLLTALYLIQPLQGRWKYANWLLAGLILAPALVSTLDAFGISQALIGSPLLYGKLDPSEFLSGFIEVGTITTGILRPVFTITLFVPLLVTLFYPTLTIGIRDRTSDADSSNMAYVLFATMLISTLLGVMRAFLNPALVVLGQNTIYTFGFAYVGLLKGSRQNSLRQVPMAIADWSMLSKLRLAVGTIALPAIVISGVVAINFFQSLLVSSTGENLALLADAELRNVADEINRQVDNLLILAEDPLIVSSVTFRESTYFNMNEEEIRSRVGDEAATWESSEDDSSFITSHLSAARSSSLTRFSEISPSHIELVLSDLYGALYTATSRTERYDQSGYIWWQEAYNNGNGAVYIGTPTFDTQSGNYIVEMAVPVFSQTRANELLGVLLSRYSLEGVNLELQLVTLGETGGLALFSGDGAWIPTDPRMVQTDPELNWDLLRDHDEPWAVTLFGGVDSIISWASTDTNEMGTYIDFQVVAQMPTDEALAGIFFVRNIGYLVFLLIAAGALAVTIIIANFMTQPLVLLTEAARKILEGETGVQAEVMGQDEIGTLASTFNSMTRQLTQLVLGLEETVSNRTLDLERRALQLETAADVARESAAIRDASELLNRATHLISQRFGYYHTGIFLLDEQKKFAVLQAANSPGGQRMLARGHKLEVGKVGVVGYAAGQAEPRIAQDVGADVIYYDNPDMPATQSEMALPLMIHDEVIGVLDVQSDQSNAFGPDDVQVLQTLADQLALAIENARLFERSQSALNELEHLYGREVGQAWKKQIGKRAFGYTYSPTGMQSSGEGLQEGDEKFQKISKKITYRGHTLGSIDLVREKGQQSFTEEELAMVDEVIEQTALALENARLSEQIKLRSDQIQLLQEVTALAASTLDEEQLLSRSVERIRTGLNLDHCAIALFLPEGDTAEWRAVSNKSISDHNLSTGTRFSLNNEVTLEVIRRKKPALFYDVQNDARRETISQITGQEGTAISAFVPMVVREQVVGLISLCDADEKRKFDVEEISLLNQISAQVSGAIDVVQLFEAEQKAREEAARRADHEHLVARITTQVRASNDPETIVQTAIDELRQALGSKKNQRDADIKPDPIETNGHETKRKAEFAKEENKDQ